MWFLPLTLRTQAMLRTQTLSSTQDKTPRRKEGGRVRGRTPIIAALGRKKWEDEEFKVILATERVQS